MKRHYAIFCLSVLLLFCCVHAWGQDRHILIYGDSITQGFARDARGNAWGVLLPPHGQRIDWWGYGMHLERMIRDGLPGDAAVYNWGYGGMRSTQAITCGADWYCIDDVLASRDADMILIMFGANDLFAGISQDATSFNLGVMLDKSLEAGITPLLGNITPNTRVRGVNDIIHQLYNPRIRALAETKGVALADHFSALIARWDAEYSSGDGLHFSDRGNEKLAETWFNALKDIQPRWKTEIGVINMIGSPFSGVLQGLDDSGALIWSQEIQLPGHGRLELGVAQVAGPLRTNIRSMRLLISEGQAVGYLKFSQAAKFRVGLEALPRPSEAGLYVPHIASNDQWWTGIGWVNTTDQAKDLQFIFDNGQSAGKSLSAHGHDAFTIASMFDGQSRPDIGTAQIQNGEGMVGLALFGAERALCGWGLSDVKARTLHFPHVVRDEEWWTGIVVYNPGSVTARLDFDFFGADGANLGNAQAQVAPGRKLAGTPDDLHFPEGAHWFSVRSSTPVMGFELFGTRNGEQLAGYSVADLAATSGVFPKLERYGWSGIALVNPGSTAVDVALEARADTGDVRAHNSVTLGPGQKLFVMAEELFPGSDLGGATYIRFAAESVLVGFQLNGSATGTMLDAVPALGSAAHAGTSALYFPHIAVD